MGDGSNFVLVLAGALLEHAEDLLRMGLSPAEVIEGYETACRKAMEILPSRLQRPLALHRARGCMINMLESPAALVCGSVEDLRSKVEVKRAVKTSVASMQVWHQYTVPGYQAPSHKYPPI